MTVAVAEKETTSELEVFLSDAPLFYQAWWLEAVAPGRWGYAAARRGSDLAAVLPYVRRINPLGQMTLAMPQLTQTLGPWLRPCEAKSAKRLAEQKDLMNELIEDLPPHSRFAQRFHPSITNWLPFYWKGFQQTTRYTYVLGPLNDLDSIWRGFASNIKTDIRKAEKQVEVVASGNLGRFIEMQSMTFARQGQRLPFTRGFLERIDAALETRQARSILFAVDSQERVHATLYLAWTKAGAYYLMGGANPELRGSGASSLLVWRAIQLAATVAASFDFEGSMIEPIERFFRAFGARQTPYFHITRSRTRHLARTVRAAAVAMAGRLGLGRTT